MEPLWRKIKILVAILLALIVSIALLIFMGFTYDDVSEQCAANKILLQKIDQHVVGKPLERYQALKGYCTASTFCMINSYCPTSYTISYKDGSFECADAEIEIFRGISVRVGRCNNF